MLISEIHQRFKIKYDKIDSNSNPELTPEAIDQILNIAQDQFIDQVYKQGIELTQELQDALAPITKRFQSNVLYTDAFSEINGKYVDLPDDYSRALMEQVYLNYPSCNQVKSGKIVSGQEYYVTDNIINYAGNDIQKNTVFVGSTQSTFTGAGKVFLNTKKWVKVVPSTRDRFLEDRENPFKKPSTEFIIRLVYGTGAKKYELISPDNSLIDSYKLDYLRDPVQMRYGTQYAVPTTDVQCELSQDAQTAIIDLAVQEASKILNQQMLKN